MEKKNPIHIKKKNEGKFTEYCKAKGFTGPNASCEEEGLASHSVHVRQMANFSRNAKHFKH